MFDNAPKNRPPQRPLTIKQVAELYEGTAVTAHTIRLAIKRGLIPHARLGRKYLVTPESVEAWLRGETTATPEPTPKPSPGTVRKIPEQ